MLIKGRLQDIYGNPLPEAHILVGNNGTTANENGEFEISANENDVVKFSYLGMETHVTTASEIEPVTILQDTAIGLDPTIITNKPTVEKTPFWKTTAFKIGVGAFIIAIIYLAAKNRKSTETNYASVDL
ncbi:carboxypeptidase-like regulatory domain-containing protein [Pseudotamlana carrageenivorans]|uniref:TonB-dependent receptor n=1 Tax=Pseudotamlana carrageenivorans TaxID=2069432 RepID=A0A2I7SER4_9FLAO|nr:carboxypeptidase-like regulatory domain-containing protein [Tamlana carrageenivorans]AUS04391.1 hypothetical protein C1A40_02390 [Tamlana carrageenivorans]